VGLFAEALGTYFRGRSLGGLATCGAREIRVCFLSGKPSEDFPGIEAMAGVERS
jgi:hypothetical protein